MDNKKLFVGGYYDDRIFKGEHFEGKTPFSEKIDTYTLNEVLKLGFVENVVGWYKEEYEKEWELSTFEEKAEAIERYAEDDEIAGIAYCKTENEAEKYKEDTLQEIAELEKEIVYIGKEQDQYGYYREVYIKK